MLYQKIVLYIIKRYNFKNSKGWKLSNILKTFIHIVNNYQTAGASVTTGNNITNNMGEGLENYEKDAFTDTMNEPNGQIWLQKFSQTYVYSGNKNNPEDLILRNCNAIEIPYKKTIK